MGRKLTSDAEQRCFAAAVMVPCPRCGVPAGKECTTRYEGVGRSTGPAGSPHLGRVKAAGVVDMLPLVAAYVRGELR